MRVVSLLALALAILVGPARAVEQPTDLDQLMEKVLARRDENWKKLQQYVLDERESFDLTGPGRVRLYGFRRDYTWFMREGFFIRSPLKADGVTISEDQRRREENEWLSREKRRDKRQRARAAEAAQKGETAATPAPVAATDESQAPTDASASAMALEPAFVSYAYFLRFKFEEGQYALAGRDTIDLRPVLKIEYYPTKLFSEGRTRPNKRVRDRDEEIEEKMNKISLVTLWVDPAERQILRYTFDDIDMDFLPGRSLVRVDDVRASMNMGQMFPNVWLPHDIEMQFRMMLAVGPVDARYLVEYHDYRQASVTYKVR
jgi:hypothetical protein